MIQRFIYTLVRSYIEFAFNVYSRRFQIEEAYKIKRKDSVIYAANHGNAFYDAFSVIFSQHKAPVYLTRAGVFGGKLANFFLNLFFMLPIYRQRDGMKSVLKNQAIMARCVEYLKEGIHPVAMFPEGNHNMKMGVRPLKKGISHLAFEALDKYPEMDLKIIPIGINYSEYGKFRADVFVKKGLPIDVRPFYEIHLTNKQEGSKMLLAKLFEQMDQLELRLPSENYETNYNLYQECRSRTADLAFNFEQDKLIIEEILQGKTPPSTRPKKNNGKLWLKRIVALPLFLIAWVTNLLPEFTLKKIIKKVVADPHFHDSIAVSIGAFLFPAFYALFAAIIGISSGNFMFGLTYLILIPFISKFYYQYLYD